MVWENFFKIIPLVGCQHDDQILFLGLQNYLTPFGIKFIIILTQTQYYHYY